MLHDYVIVTHMIMENMHNKAVSPYPRGGVLLCQLVTGLSPKSNAFTIHIPSKVNMLCPKMYQ